jgi:general secretion pathway protein D
MMTHPAFARTKAITLAATLALILGPGALLPLDTAVAATKKRAVSAAPVTLNFVNADVEGVTRAMAAIINRQILVDPRVKGTITLYSEQPMSPSDAYLAYLSALRGQGFSMIEVAGLLKVVPEADAKLQSGTVEVGNRSTRTGDQILTQIFRLQFENVNSMVTVLRPLISPNNTINANPATNSLVITDYADNLKRIGQIIAAMDNPATTDLEMIPLQHTVAADLAPVIAKLADTGTGAVGGGGGATLTVVAEPRSNSLMVRAPNAARMAIVKTLVSRLDKPGANGVAGSGINVVYLKNADAVKLAQILRAAFPGGGSGGGSSSSGTAPSTGQPTGANTNNASGTATGASTQSTTPVSGSAGPSTGGFVQADPATNSLIITAPEGLYRQLRAVIDQLDGRRAQIYIESIIVQVDESRSAQLGVEWQGLLGKDGDRALVGLGTNFGSIVKASTGNLTSASEAIGPGFNVGVLRSYEGKYSLAALANFLKTDSGTNLLSTPNLVTLDNEEAKIVIGENRPFLTGAYSTTSGTNGNPFQTVERKDVGLTLRVKPQVGENGTVRMTVYQENSSVKDGTEGAASGLTTTKSSIETTVVVDDGQVLVLGGLLKDDYQGGANKVPGVGDIPLLGRLFGNENRKRSKTNLMVFLRPVVMRTQEASDSLTVDRYEYMRKRQAATTPEKSWVLPINEVPMLPSLKLSPMAPAADSSAPSGMTPSLPSGTPVK